MNNHALDLSHAAPAHRKKKKIYLPNESHIKLNQINAKDGLPEEQTLINAGRPYHITIM